MAKQIQLRRGTTAEHNTFTGALGEVTVDTNKGVLVYHDGATVGGFPSATTANANGTISLIRKDGGVSGTISAAGLFYNGTDSAATDQAATAMVAQNLQWQISNTNNQLLGVGQSWQNVQSSRAVGTTYTNSTGRPIVVCVSAREYAKSSLIIATVQGFTFRIGADSHAYDTYATGSVVVPNGATYSITITQGNLETWAELR